MAVRWYGGNGATFYRRTAVPPYRVVFASMAEELSKLPTQRAAGWAAIGIVIAAAVALYFIYSPAVPPLTEQAAVDTTVSP